MIKVMIAEDNQSLCENCFEFLTNDEDIKVVSCTLDGKSTLEKYLEIKPDVLLLDLDLPKITGIEVINFLSRFSEERDKCNIIVVSGSVELLSEVLKLNMYIGLDGPLTFTNAKTPKEVCEKVPLDRLLLETDSPYLAPHPLRGTINEPKNIALILDEVTRIKGISKKKYK